MGLMKHVVYIDGVTKKYRIIVTYIVPETFDTEAEAEEFARRFDTGLGEGEACCDHAVCPEMLARTLTSTSTYSRPGGRSYRLAYFFSSRSWRAVEVWSRDSRA